MKAVIQHAYGSPDVLEIADIDTPTMGADEILVDVRASTVTQGDRRVRAADYPRFLRLIGRLVTGIFGPRHRIPGTNFAGEVVAVGEEVTRFTPGDEVFGACMHGAHAEFLCVSEESSVAHMPSGFAYDEVVDFPYGAGTALAFLRDQGGIEAGDRVLVIGAAGGVGRYAVQLAAHFGAEVTGVCHANDADLVRKLGARKVIDYSTEKFTERGETWDLILDTSGTAGYRASRDALAENGRFLSLLISLELIGYSILTWITRKRRAITGVATDSRQRLEDLRELADQGAVRPVIDCRYPLERIGDAHRRLDSGEARGSVVVTIDDRQGRRSPPPREFDRVA